tara:strand:- start:122 stop:529 length:408 start_codon:yes stop_codon:yes gene_type:complete
MKKYFRTEYTGTIPSIRGHRFHPSMFYGTQDEMDDILDYHLSGHEDDFKIMSVKSFDTIEEFNKHYPALGKGEPIPVKKLEPMEFFAKRDADIRDKILRDTARGRDCTKYYEMLSEETTLYTSKGVFSNLRGQIS